MAVFGPSYLTGEDLVHRLDVLFLVDCFELFGESFDAFVEEGEGLPSREVHFVDYCVQLFALEPQAEEEAGLATAESAVVVEAFHEVELGEVWDQIPDHVEVYYVVGVGF